MLFDFFWVWGIVGNRGESWGFLSILFLIGFQVFREHVASLVLLLLHLLVLFNYKIPGSGFMRAFLPRESLRCHGVAVRGRGGTSRGRGASRSPHPAGEEREEKEHPAARFPALRVFGSLNMHLIRGVASPSIRLPQHLSRSSRQAY